VLEGVDWRRERFATYTRVSIEEVHTSIALAKKMGIRTGTFIMLGYPGETEHDILQTLDYLKHSDPDEFTITLTYPIAGTPLYDEVVPQLPVYSQWYSTSDREIIFDRTYSERYYRSAIRFVTHRAALTRQLRRHPARLATLVHWLKASSGKLGMWWEKMIA
jgi:anaerobic magnesium-protoporphyrin IX monomethyl ester cyclase